MERELENVLRAAPRPTPPPGLKDHLLAQVRLPVIRPAAQASPSPLTLASWLSRWWPVLGPAAVSAACAVGLTMQQMEIRHLKQAIQDLSPQAAPKPGLVPSPTLQTNDAAPHADAAARTQQEIARLKALAGQLTAEVAQLEQLRADNVKLRTQLAAPPAGFLTPEETEALGKARERAESIACCNNLKQFALAARTWAIDHGDLSPPDILAMKDELNTPKILVCPADRAREAARNWASYTPAHCSYEYLAPSAPDTEPNRVLSRCPIHGNIGLVDGSVQRELAKRHPEQLVPRDGKLYYVLPLEPDKPASVPQPPNPPPSGSNP